MLIKIRNWLSKKNEERRAKKAKKYISRIIGESYFTQDKGMSSLKECSLLISLNLKNSINAKLNKTLAEEWGELVSYLPLTYRFERQTQIASEFRRNKINNVSSIY